MLYIYIVFIKNIIIILSQVILFSCFALCKEKYKIITNEKRPQYKQLLNNINFDNSLYDWQLNSFVKKHKMKRQIYIFIGNRKIFFRINKSIYKPKKIVKKHHDIHKNVINIPHFDKKFELVSTTINSTIVRPIPDIFLSRINKNDFTSIMRIIKTFLLKHKRDFVKVKYIVLLNKKNNNVQLIIFVSENFYDNLRYFSMGNHNTKYYKNNNSVKLERVNFYKSEKKMEKGDVSGILQIKKNIFDNHFNIRSIAQQLYSKNIIFHISYHNTTGIMYSIKLNNNHLPYQDYTINTSINKSKRFLELVSNYIKNISNNSTYGININFRSSSYKYFQNIKIYHDYYNSFFRNKIYYSFRLGDILDSSIAKLINKDNVQHFSSIVGNTLSYNYFIENLSQSSGIISKFNNQLLLFYNNSIFLKNDIYVKLFKSIGTNNTFINFIYRAGQISSITKTPYIYRNIYYNNNSAQFLYGKNLGPKTKNDNMPGMTIFSLLRLEADIIFLNKAPEFKNLFFIEIMNVANREIWKITKSLPKSQGHYIGSNRINVGLNSSLPTYIGLLNLDLNLPIRMIHNIDKINYIKFSIN